MWLVLRNGNGNGDGGRPIGRTLLRPEEVLLAAFVLILAAIIATTGEFHFTAFRHPRFLQCLAVLAGAVAARAYLRERVAASRPVAVRRSLASLVPLARDFAPFFAVLLLYETLHDLTPVLRPIVVDNTLIAIDRALFGVDVSLWMGGFATPTLTRAMVLCYASYFVAPALLASAIYWTGDRRLFRDLMISGAIASLLGFTGYLLVPAVGPYVHQAALFPTRLPGGGPDTHLFIAAIDDLKGVARDCFPSLHTAHTTIVLWFAARFRRWAFLLYLPIALGLYVSTIYLRMHYVIDVAAGFVTAAIAIYLGPRLDRFWAGTRPAT
ncbi:MAG: phosphatase PAP2 family protein [Myxococcales bacterium]|nr:phosphatase PAP2 family protein [Myxococcales bacterium]